MLHRYLTKFSFSISILLYCIQTIDNKYYSRRLLNDDGRGVGESLHEDVCTQDPNVTCEGLKVWQCHQLLVYIFMHPPWSLYR